MRYALLALPLLLSGCMTFEVKTAPDKMADQIVQGAGPERPHPGPSPVTPSSTGGMGKSDLDAAVSKIHEDITSSNNANQNTITGLGANVNKLAEKIQGFGGDLAHVEASVTAKFDASIETKFQAVVKQNAELKIEMSNSANAYAQATATLKQTIGDLSAKVDAQAKGQLAYEARMEELKQDIKAGRDAITTNIQYTDNMMNTVLGAYKAMIAIVMVGALLLVAVVWELTRRSRDRAEMRYHQESTERKVLTEKLIKNLGGHHAA